MSVKGELNRLTGNITAAYAAVEELSGEIPAQQTSARRIDMDVFYNKHYIKTDTQSRITDGWSDGPHLHSRAAAQRPGTDAGGC